MSLVVYGERHMSQYVERPMYSAVNPLRFDDCQPSMLPTYDSPPEQFGLGPEFTIGWRETLVSGVKNILKKIVGDPAFDEYERMEKDRHRAYREEMSSKVVVPSTLTEEEVVLKSLNTTTVVHVPRVVVHVVCEMRMKLGLGAMDRNIPGNVALVRAEAARIMRNMNMRKLDAAAHLTLVEECFFGENTHYNATRWRQRVVERNILTRWLYKRESSPYGFDC